MEKRIRKHNVAISILRAIQLICFFIMLGIVGSVENGAPLNKMLYLIPFLVVFAILVPICNTIEDHKNRLMTSRRNYK